MYHHLLGSISFEVPPPQKSFAQESAQLICPSLVSLVCPNPLKVERIIAPSCSSPCSRADHLQPTQQKLGLGPDSNYRQGPSPPPLLFPFWGPATLTLEIAKW